MAAKTATEALSDKNSPDTQTSTANPKSRIKLNFQSEKMYVFTEGDQEVMCYPISLTESKLSICNNKTLPKVVLHP